jgi:hypothetical protein
MEAQGNALGLPSENRVSLEGAAQEIASFRVAFQP